MPATQTCAPGTARARAVASWKKRPSSCFCAAFSTVNRGSGSRCCRQWWGQTPHSAAVRRGLGHFLFREFQQSVRRVGANRMDRMGWTFAQPVEAVSMVNTVHASVRIIFNYRRKTRKPKSGINFGRNGRQNDDWALCPETPRAETVDTGATGFQNGHHLSIRLRLGERAGELHHRHSGFAGSLAGLSAAAVGGGCVCARLHGFGHPGGACAFSTAGAAAHRDEDWRRREEAASDPVQPADDLLNA